MTELVKWVTDTLQAASLGPAALPLAFLLGVVSALASACCTVPAMGMLVAYSGTQQNVNRRSSLISAAWFLVGTALALVILGLVAGLAGQAAQAFLGRYWKLFAGAVAVVLGLASLNLLPFRLPGRTPAGGVRPASGDKRGAAWGGLFLGGGVAACSLPCNPGIFIILGASVMMGRLWWGMALMAAFAVGFSLPLSAVFFGVSSGTAALSAQKAAGVIRVVAGGLLVIAGFYLLGTGS